MDGLSGEMIKTRLLQITYCRALLLSLCAQFTGILSCDFNEFEIKEIIINFNQQLKYINEGVHLIYFIHAAFIKFLCFFKLQL